MKIKLEKRVPFVPRAPHHGYMGIMLIFLGWTMIPYAIYNGLDTLLLTAGALILADDLIEHTLTGSTPLYAFFNKVLIPLLMRINK